MQFLQNVKLEERTCACGCHKKFRCLATSKTRYSSQHCMEIAGVLPPPLEKKGYGGAKAARAPVADDKDDAEDVVASEDSDIPLLLEEDEELAGEDSHLGPSSKNPPEIDPGI